MTFPQTLGVALVALVVGVVLGRWLGWRSGVATMAQLAEEARAECAAAWERERVLLLHHRHERGLRRQEVSHSLNVAHAARDARDWLAEAIADAREGREPERILEVLAMAHNRLEVVGLGDGDPNCLSGGPANG